MRDRCVFCLAAFDSHRIITGLDKDWVLWDIESDEIVHFERQAH